MNEKTETRNMALFCDFENVALGVRDAKYAAFDIQKVMEICGLKGIQIWKIQLAAAEVGEDDPRWGLGWSARARLAADQGQLDEAELWCQAAIRGSGSDPALHYLLAMILQPVTGAASDRSGWLGRFGKRRKPLGHLLD